MLIQFEGSSPLLELYDSLRAIITSLAEGTHALYELTKDHAELKDHLEDNACEIWDCSFKQFYSSTESRIGIVKELLSKSELSEWNITQCQRVLQLVEEDERFLFVRPVPTETQEIDVNVFRCTFWLTFLAIKVVQKCASCSSP